MCGIAGSVHFNTVLGATVANAVGKMAEKLLHRGPDSGGLWSDESFGIALAHRRLAILDLSPAGHQPMMSESGRYVLVFNGEIYNHLDIRNELQSSNVAINWRGHSDTETLLASVERWGFETALKKVLGMFALALWDRQTRILFLARDRMGEKPLYYGWQRGDFVFASECKALRAHPSFEGEIDRQALTLFFRYNCIPAPLSIYQGINKLSPGAYLKVSFQSRSEKKIELHQYWSMQDVVLSGKRDRFPGDETESVSSLEGLLRSAVKQQMISDVPLGAFLSGGVDSSTVVALMQAQSKTAIKTFTIGFHEDEFNEAEQAKLVAKHLKTDHTEMYVRPKEAMGVIPKLPTIYDEPFSDSSQIPTFLISQLTKKHVTVSLSGDGGDELFGGYNRYLGTQNWWGKLRATPTILRTALSRASASVSPAFWDKFSPGLGNRMQKIEGVLKAKDANDLYSFFTSHWASPETVVINGRDNNSSASKMNIDLENIIERMMYMDMVSYLPNDILVKVDRAAMAVSLETRVPFLDHRIVEFSWRLPLNMKIRDGQTKWLLRQVLYRYIPKEIIDRPKKGFAVPLDRWLRGPLRDWAEGLLDNNRLGQEGYLHPSPIRKAWEEHLSGRRNRAQQLWDVLMFQAWLESIS